MPEAPPVTIALAPLMSMAGILERRPVAVSTGSARGDQDREGGAEAAERCPAAVEPQPGSKGREISAPQQLHEGRSPAGHDDVRLAVAVGPDEPAVTDLQPVLLTVEVEPDAQIDPCRGHRVEQRRPSSEDRRPRAHLPFDGLVEERDPEAGQRAQHRDDPTALTSEGVDRARS